MKNYQNFKEEAMEIANEYGHRKMDVCHIERAMAEDTTFATVFKNVASEEDYNNLLDYFDEVMAELPAFSPSVISSHIKAGKELNIQESHNIEGFESYVKMATQARWSEPGEALASHMMMSLFANAPGSIIAIYCEKSLIDSDDLVNALIDAEADSLGIEPNYRTKSIGEILAGQTEDENGWKKFVINMNEKAASYKKPLVGRIKETNRMVQIFARMDKSNPILVGEPGVGKTEIIMGFAKMIIEGKVPHQLEGVTVYSVDLPGMLAGSKYRGEFEAKIKALLDGVKDQKVILFFDEIHTIVGAGATSGGSMDAANILKPYLTDGNIKFVGATTYKEFKNIEKDSALMRRFQKIDVVEPSVDEAIEILNGLKEYYGEYHGVTYTADAIKSAVELTAKYVHDRFLPDKAIDMIDEAGAAASIAAKKEVTSSDIEDTISVLCKIPKKTMEKDEFSVVNELSSNLRKKVFGQNTAVEEIVDAIKLSKSGLGDDNKPIASFLFVGPTGTGKTEIAKQLAENLSIELVRFDMSEYMEENSVSKLIGTSAGYVGYEDGGILTEAIRKTPHCVLLLDEIEKAHPSIFKSFLQVMDYGKMTDNKGRTVDFRNTIIIMTSNAGATAASKPSLGFGKSGSTSTVEINKDGIKDAVKNLFSPEFRNRLTKTVIFNGITEEIGKMVVNKELKALSDKLANKGLSASYTDACVDELVKRGVSPEFGAREIQRLVNSEIKVKFVDKILSGSRVKKYVVDYNGKDFTVESARVKNTTKATEALS